MRLLSCAAALLLSLTPSTWNGLLAADAAPAERFSGWAVLGPEGRLLELDRPESPAVRDALRTQLFGQGFRPASTRGTAVAVRTWLEGGFSLSAEGEVQGLVLTSIRLGPRAVSVTPPRYPSNAIPSRWKATVVVGFEIGEAGLPEQLEILSNDGDAVFARAVEVALRDWRFEPERIGGSVIRSRLAVPLLFSIGQSPLETARLPRIQPHAERALGPGQSGLWETIEVIASRP
jgi:TonB family protein